MSPNLFYLVEYHHLRKHHGQLTVERGLVNFFAVRYKVGDEIQSFTGNEMTLEIESFMENVNTCKAVNFPFCLFDLRDFCLFDFDLTFFFSSFPIRAKAKLGERALNLRGEWGRGD